MEQTLRAYAAQLLRMANDITALADRVAAEAATPVPPPPAPQPEPEPTPPVSQPEPTTPPAPPVPATLNRPLLGLAIPDGEMRTGTAAKISRIRDLGVTAVRMDVRPETALSQYDGVIRALRDAGIDVLAILGGNLKVATVPEAEAFARQVEQTVKWLADRGVSHVQWWNEPNHSSRITTPENYARAIRLAYPAAKSVNPNVFCVAAGLSGINDSVNGHISTVDWLRRSYAAGAKGQYDAQAMHPYSYPYHLDNPADWTGWGNLTKRFRPFMEANGEGNLKVWATEAGFPTAGGTGNTEANQKAMYADKLLAEIRKLPWLGPVFHYGLDDRGGVTTDAENWFGLYRPNGTAKPAAAALKAAVGQIK